MADVAALVFEIDSSRARTAATDLAKLNDAAVKVSAGFAKSDAALRKANGQFASTATVVDKYGREVRQLAAEFNPALNAVYQFQEAETRLNRAVALGVLSLEQKEAALERIRADYAASAVAANQFGAAQKASGAQTANVFSQLNDIGVMLAAGQNPFQLAMQQGTQLNQVWAGMGAQGRTLGGVARVLGGAFMSMLSPMSLLTIGVIAGSAALVNWMTASDGAASGSEAFTNKISELQEYIDALNDSLALTLPANFDAALEKYGSLNQQVRDHVVNMDALNAQLLSISQINVTNMFKEDFGGWLTTQIDEMRIAFGRTNDNARQLVALMADIDKAQGPRKQADALDDLIRELVRAAGGVGNLNTKQAEFVLKLQQARDVALQGAKNLEKLEPPINNATAAAGRLLSVLQQIADSPFPPMLGRFDPFGAGLGSPLAPRESIRPPKAPTELGVPEPKKGGGGGGAGARELKAAEKGFQSLRELLEQETLFEYAEFEKRQAQLDAALAKKLLSEKNYQLIKGQLQTTFFGTEFEQQNLRYIMEQEQLDLALEQKRISEERHAQEVSRIRAAQQSASLAGYETFFGNMAKAAQAGGDKATAAVRSFSIAQGLLNSYLAYTQVLADPSLIGRPFLRTALAASTLVSGLAQVAAMKGGGGGASASAGATAAARTEPQRNILVRLEGPDFMVDMAESIMQQIYEQSGDGRVVIQRDR